MVAQKHDNIQIDDPRREVDLILEAVVYLYTESRRVTKELAKRHGLTGPQVTALKILEAFQSLSLSELSAHMSAKNSTITGIVDRMEQQDLVRRERSQRDRRVIKIRPTERGLALAATIPVNAMELFQRAVSALSHDDRENLTRILTLLAREVREQVAAQHAAETRE